MPVGLPPPKGDGQRKSPKARQFLRRGGEGAKVANVPFREADEPKRVLNVSVHDCNSFLPSLQFSLTFLLLIFFGYLGCSS